MRKTLKELVGNVKRKYSTEDFNPFATMDWIYSNCLHTGAGSTVLIVGHSKRFKEDILTAWQHVMLSRGIMKPSDEYPLLQANEFITHTGACLRFESFEDVGHDMMRMLAACKESSIIALCSKYNSPDMKNAIREASVDSLVYDFSENNVEKSVDK